MHWTSLLFSALVHSCLASPGVNYWADLVEKHSWAEIPAGWEYHSTPSPDYKLDLRLGLKSHRMDELINSLYEVSDPAHERYGAHLSKEEVEALVAPHPDSVEAVESWLQHHGINTGDAVHKSGGGDWITVRVTIAQAENMLGAKYSVYRHSKSSDYAVRTLRYSLPRKIYDHIDVAAPTTYFGTLRSMRATSFLQPIVSPLDISKSMNKIDGVQSAGAPLQSNCKSIVTPSCLRHLYKTENYTPKATEHNSIGIAGYLNEYGNRDDLQIFYKQFRPDAVGSSYTTVLVNGGGDNQSDPGIEANLDIQYALGIAFPTPAIYYSTGGSPPFNPDSVTPINTNEPYLDWLDFILNKTSIPDVITTSYGENEQTIPLDYRKKVCDSFAQLGARGSSILFSSGDFGVGDGDCQTNDGTNSTKFQPAFPASCPYVTAVGGTIGFPEKAVSFSGGGFSNTFARPAYQDDAVSAYLTALGTTYNGLFNATGRAYPDISAQASRFQVVVGGKNVSVGGTSASSPTVAGIIALLNDARLASGRPPLGFLNPLLYSNRTSGFNDITEGNNPGCNTRGFNATLGWDPVTGLGTPNFKKLRESLC